MGRLPRVACLAVLFVHGDFKSTQEAMILGSELDLSGGLEALVSCWFFDRLDVVGFFLVAVLVSPIEADRRFQDQKYIVACALDLSDRLRDPVGLGKGIVNRMP